jgi:hypothetical protein
MMDVCRSLSLGRICKLRPAQVSKNEAGLKLVDLTVRASGRGGTIDGW